MNDRDQRRYDRLIRVQTYGRSHAAAFADGSLLQTTFAALDALLVKIDAAKAAQSPARVSKASLVDALLLDFKAIARTARAIEQEEPGFGAPYRLPDGFAEGAILTHADALLAELDDAPADGAALKAAKAARRAKFVRYELPTTFVADLRADRDALREIGSRNTLENLEQVQSTAILGELLLAGTMLVQRLDAALQNKFMHAADQLAEWSSASRTERGSRARASANTTINANGAGGGNGNGSAAGETGNGVHAAASTAPSVAAPAGAGTGGPPSAN